MHNIIVLNAFSLNMLSEKTTYARFDEMSVEDIKIILENENFESAVGHEDTAAVFSEQIGVTIPMNRKSVSLKKGDSAIVGQYRGPRLPEGCKTLPEGASIVWYGVSIIEL